MYKETTGKIVAMLGSKFGKTKSGKDYETREYLIEQGAGTEHVHCVKFTMASFDGPIQNPIQVGEEVKVGLRIVATQYNGKWYNDITLVSWEKLI